MTSNLKVILSAAAVAALLASPAAANERRHSGVRHVPNNAYGFVGPSPYYVPNNAYGFVGRGSGDTLSDRWRATHSGSWDATHDPRENPQQ